MTRHKAIQWTDLQARLEANSKNLWLLNEMERTGGEPDVVAYDKERAEFIFFDCSPESPKGRRSLCYDRDALESRKKYRPENSVVDMTETMGIELLTQEQYRELQKPGCFDTKTSSWIKHHQILEKSAVPSFAIVAITRFFYIIMELNHIMAPEGFEAL